jgi:two-component system NarL family sensor kinase
VRRMRVFLTAHRAAVLIAAAVLTMAVVIAGEILGTANHAIENVGVAAGVAIPFTLLGGLVLAGKPGHPVGRLMCAAGVTATLWWMALSWHEVAPIAWISQWLWWPCLGLISLALLLFPDGTLLSGRWRIAAAAVVLGTVIGSALIAVAAVDEPRLLTWAGARPAPWALQLWDLARIAAFVTVGGLLTALLSLVARWHRADGDTRRQLNCLLPAAVLFVAALVLSSYGTTGAWAGVAAAIPVGMTVAILRYRLYDVDLIVNRTIVWFLMTTLVVVGVVGVVAVVRLLSGPLSPVPEGSATVLTIGLAVVVFEPLHRRVQRGVVRFLYGDRDDPFVVLQRLGDVLRRTVDPGAVMPLVTETVARSLQLPYAAVELSEYGETSRVAGYGRPVLPTESFDMVSRGERIGQLHVGRRSSGAAFTRRERRLLREVAVQAAVAADATRLNRDLQFSRLQLVTAREEERRRLQQELHDGLGPNLAGVSMQVRAAQRGLPADSRVGAILSRVAADLQTCSTEVRQLVAALRPRVLNEGLEAALRAECARFDGEIVSVRCDVSRDVEGLPAAVEVAAYRVVGEALTNVARHARAENCVVTVRQDGQLHVEIVDDGVGISPSAPPGVGVPSMRERAAELGGTCTVEAAPVRGTVVRLQLPLPTAHPPASVAPTTVGVS